MAEISLNWYPIYDQNSRKTIPVGAAHKFLLYLSSECILPQVTDHVHFLYIPWQEEILLPQKLGSPLNVFMEVILQFLIKVNNITGHSDRWLIAVNFPQLRSGPQVFRASGQFVSSW